MESTITTKKKIKKNSEDLNKKLKLFKDAVKSTKPFGFVFRNNLNVD